MKKKNENRQYLNPSMVIHQNLNTDRTHYAEYLAYGFGDSFCLPLCYIFSYSSHVFIGIKNFRKFENYNIKNCKIKQKKKGNNSVNWYSQKIIQR